MKALPLLISLSSALDRCYSPSCLQLTRRAEHLKGRQRNRHRQKETSHSHMLTGIISIRHTNIHFITTVQSRIGRNVLFFVFICLMLVLAGGFSSREMLPHSLHWHMRLSGTFPPKPVGFENGNFHSRKLGLPGLAQFHGLP